jgi:hypothetical protein
MGSTIKFLYILDSMDDLIKIYTETGKFSAQEGKLTESEVGNWVRFVTDPQRFLPSIFDGNWARPDKHPTPGTIKLLRVIEGNDGVVRLIGRQSGGIYATPWIG